MPNKVNDNLNEISLKDIYLNAMKWLNYLVTNWWKIILVGLIGGVFGFIYAGNQPVTFTAKTTFVVEEGKNSTSNLGGLASLAGQFGVDVSGGGGGVFSGDNILLYFKSNSLAREVLLSRYDTNSLQSVADVYIAVYGLKETWEKSDNIGKVNFPSLDLKKKYSRLQDSLLQIVINGINNKQFSIAKTDKKSSFIEVSVTMQNENLAKVYCDRVVELAVEKYLVIKTKRQKVSVDKLQARVDSIANLLRQKTVSGASLQTNSSTMDINPMYRTGTTVAVESTLRDKNMLASIFATVTQNLEMAKFTLSQETPLIQIIDYPILPLNKEKKSKMKTSIIFSLSLSLIFSIFLIAKKMLTTTLK